MPRVLLVILPVTRIYKESAGNLGNQFIGANKRHK